MNLVSNITRWLASKLGPNGCADAFCVARRVPEWGLVEMPELRQDLVVKGPYVGFAPTQ